MLTVSLGSAGSRLKSAVLFAIIAAVVHIVTTLWLAHSREAPLLVALLDRLPANRLTILDPVTPENQAYPFQMPESHYAICPYDLSETPVRIEVHLPDQGWVFSLHSLNGEGFYFAPGAANGELTVAVDLVPPGDALNGLELSARPEDLQTAKVIVPALRGFAIVRAPLPGLSYAARAVAGLAKTACGPVGRPIPKPSVTAYSGKSSQSR